MSRIKTYIPGGRFFPEEINAIQDRYELGFSNYKFLTRFNAYNNGQAFTGSTNYIVGSTIGTGNSFTAPGTKTADNIFFTPTGFAGNTRLTKIIARFQFSHLASATIPTVTAGFGRITIGGGSAAIPTIATLTSESSVVIPIPLPANAVTVTGITDPFTIADATARACYFSFASGWTSGGFGINADLFYQQV